MTTTQQVPMCVNAYNHDFFFLGINDAGEKVSRCGSCMTMKYEDAASGLVRYQLPPENTPPANAGPAPVSAKPVQI